MARPDMKIIVFDGDGSLLMNLGSMVTIANMAPPNLIHFVFENGIYRTTGCQPIPGVSKINFTGFARDAGYAQVHEFEKLHSLEKTIETVMKQRGPIFVCLKILGSTEKCPLPYTSTKLRMIKEFKEALGGSSF